MRPARSYPATTVILPGVRYIGSIVVRLLTEVPLVHRRELVVFNNSEV